MDETRTPSQIKQLKTWAEERDEMLSGNATLRDEQGRLQTAVRTLSESFKDLDVRVKRHEAVLSMADKLEKDRANLISRELYELEKKVTLKEVRLTYLEKEVEAGEMRKAEVLADIKIDEDLHTKVFGKITVLDKLLDYVTRGLMKNHEIVNQIASDVKAIIPESLSKEKKGVTPLRPVPKVDESLPETNL